MDLEKIVSIAELAGEAILEIYSKPESLKIQNKGDNSPLTEADLAAHNIIVEELQKIDDTPIVSEEGNEGDPLSNDTCWLFLTHLLNRSFSLLLKAGFPAVNVVEAASDFPR